MEIELDYRPASLSFDQKAVSDLYCIFLFFIFVWKSLYSNEKDQYTCTVSSPQEVICYQAKE